MKTYKKIRLEGQVRERIRLLGIPDDDAAREIISKFWAKPGSTLVVMDNPDHISLSVIDRPIAGIFNP